MAWDSTFPWNGVKLVKTATLLAEEVKPENKDVNKTWCRFKIEVGDGSLTARYRSHLQNQT